MKIRAPTTSQSFETMVHLNKKVRMELEWWITMLEKWNGHPILPLTPDLTIEMDASLLGWGAAAGERST